MAPLPPAPRLPEGDVEQRGAQGPLSDGSCGASPDPPPLGEPLHSCRYHWTTCPPTIYQTQMEQPPQQQYE
ncbi:unnamed protein product, partial [Discosporangium mesarthrocarpum]